MRNVPRRAAILGLLGLAAAATSAAPATMQPPTTTKTASSTHTHPDVLPYPDPSKCKGKFAFVTIKDSSFTADSQATGADLYQVDSTGKLAPTPFASWTPTKNTAFHPKQGKITVRIDTTTMLKAASKVLPGADGIPDTGTGTGTALVLTVTTTTVAAGVTTITTSTSDPSSPMYVDPTNLDPCP